MKDIVYKLKEEHRRLAIEFQGISCGIPAREFKFKVKNIHDRLFSHLERENEELYPCIEKVSANPETRILIASFKSINEIMPGLKRLCNDIVTDRSRFNIPTHEVNSHLLNLFLQRFKREEELLFRGVW